MRTRLSVLPAVAILSGLMVGCSGGGGGSSPTAPTAPTASTRVISVSGNLAFGDVLVGDSRNSTLTITNTGNAPMSVTGLNVSGGLGPHLTASWTSGQVPAGGSQNVTITFAPTAPGDFSGTVTVVANRVPFEVTTLREDVETFGRHARVAFTADWAADARRRGGKDSFQPKDFGWLDTGSRPVFFWSGGGGGSRTRVRKPSAVGSTCLAESIVLAEGNPTGRANHQRVR